MTGVHVLNSTSFLYVPFLFSFNYVFRSTSSLIGFTFVSGFVVRYSVTSVSVFLLYVGISVLKRIKLPIKKGLVISSTFSDLLHFHPIILSVIKYKFIK